MNQGNTNDQGASVYGFLTYRIARVQVALNLHAQRLLQEHSTLTQAQWRILALIGSEGETQSVHLSKAHGLDKGLLSRNIKSLIEQKLVISSRPRGDRRVQKLKLSEPGQELFTRILPIMTKRQSDLKTVLNPHELEMFESYLTKLEDFLNAGRG